MEKRKNEETYRCFRKMGKKTEKINSVFISFGDGSSQENLRYVSMYKFRRSVFIYSRLQ